jgi:hypothetical protein
LVLTADDCFHLYCLIDRLKFPFDAVHLFELIQVSLAVDQHHFQEITVMLIPETCCGLACADA